MMLTASSTSFLLYVARYVFVPNVPHVEIGSGQESWLMYRLMTSGPGFFPSYADGITCDNSECMIVGEFVLFWLFVGVFFVPGGSKNASQPAMIWPRYSPVTRRCSAISISSIFDKILVPFCLSGNECD